MSTDRASRVPAPPAQHTAPAPRASHTAPAPRASQAPAAVRGIHGELHHHTDKEKMSIISSQRPSTDHRKQHKPKPWEDATSSPRKATGGIRTRLPGIEAYDRDLEYHHLATPKVTLRLERVVGSGRLRINDNKFMTTLSRRIEDEETKLWKNRVKVRQNNELERYRQLIIDGIMEPSASMQKLRTHPIFRVNRMMKRISKLSYDHHTTPPPPITPIEPFEEQERTGYLFGSHKHHYLRVKRPMSPAKSSYPTTRTSGDLDGPSSAGSKISFQHTPTQSEGAEEEEGYEPEMWEGDADQSRPLTSRPSQTGALADFLRQQSLTQARKYFGLDEGELRKNFEITPNPCVEAVHDDKEHMNDMFDYSSNLLKSYEREQLKTDDFISKVLRKLV